MGLETWAHGAQGALSVAAEGRPGRPMSASNAEPAPSPPPLYLDPSIAALGLPGVTASPCPLRLTALSRPGGPN